MAETWWSQASCAGLDPAAWFPDRHSMADDYRYALGVCECCPVRHPCLTWAIAHHENEGIWGQRSARQRRAAPKRCKACSGLLTAAERATNLLSEDPRWRCTACEERYALPVRISPEVALRARRAALRAKTRWQPAWRGNNG